MQQIHRVKGNITATPNSTEKYLSFGVGQLKFLDSLQFMLSSLERLVDATDKADFHLTRAGFGHKTDLIFRKGVYSYEYIDSLDKFQETQLPQIDKLYSKLSYESVKPKDYEHAQNIVERVWLQESW